jgi:aminopeptidase N
MFYPEWRMHHFMNIFAIQGNAFRVDARTSTRAMTTMGYTPAEVSALFDSIAYDKSASVLRMFEYAVGEKIFREALNLHVTTK